MNSGIRDTGHGTRERIPEFLLGAIFFGALALLCVLPSLWRTPPTVLADSYSSHRFPTFGYILDNPLLTIAGATVTTSPTSTTGANLAHLSWVFGTVSGNYGTCTVQAKTSYDGVNFETLGSAASVTATTNTVNVWDVMAQLPTTSVTTTSPSSSVATGFGELTEYTFNCSSFGTAAPVAIEVIYK